MKALALLLLFGLVMLAHAGGPGNGGPGNGGPGNGGPGNGGPGNGGPGNGGPGNGGPGNGGPGNGGPGNDRLEARIEALERGYASINADFAAVSRKLRLSQFVVAAQREQFLYNRDIDRAFSIGFTQAYSADFNASVDRIMSHFCSDSIFWAAYVNGVPVLSATNFAAVRGVYASVSATNYANFSRHIITNPMPTLSVVGGKDYLELNASIMQPAIKRIPAGQAFKYVDGSDMTDASGNVLSAPYTWNWSIGWYHNQWRLNSDDSVCMTRFEAWTMSQHDFSATYTHDYILRADLL